MAEKDVEILAQEYFQKAYESGSRWEDRAKEIAKFLKKGSIESEIIINLACDFIEQTSDWADLQHRFYSIFDPLQKGEGGAMYWVYGNTRFKKCMANEYAQLLGKYGLPAGKDFQRFSSDINIFFGIDAMKEVSPAQFAEEEVPQEETITVEKGWLFKKNVVEKRIVMKKIKKEVKGVQKVPKTVQELIQEITRFS